MITVERIKNASDTIELEELVSQAAIERGIELSQNMAWGEEAKWLEEQVEEGHFTEEAAELAEILRAAEERWFEVQ